MVPLLSRQLLSLDAEKSSSTLQLRCVRKYGAIGKSSKSGPATLEIPRLIAPTTSPSFRVCGALSSSRRSST